jgi:predicted transcriptional regulator
VSEQLGLDLDDAPKMPRRGALRSFHARGHVRPADALAGEARNRGQEECIHAWIRAQGAGRRFTPREVHAAFPGLELTSVRRALTDLTTAGRLVHYDEDLRRGPKGTESTWAVA